MTEKKKRFVSLSVKPLFVLLLGLILAAGVYAAASFAGNQLIERQYLSETAILKRTGRAATELQRYVRQNGLSTRDTSSLAQWGKSRKDLYISLYRDQRLVLEISWWGADSGPTDAYTLKEQNATAVYPIVFRDGTFYAVITDNSDVRLYDLVWIVSLVLACAVLALALLIYNRKITKKIVAVAHEVQSIGEGNLYLQLTPEGNDELTQLTASVEQMRLSLLRKTSEEQRALQQNSDLITAMSHDIRNPLTALLGYLDIISAQRDLPPDTVSYLAACQERAGRIKQLTDELFRYSLLFSNDELPMRLETYDAYVLLEQLLGEAQAELESAGFATRMVMPDTFCRVRVDVPYFKRVLDNLFANVRKYADPAQPVSIAALPENRTLHICICNTIRADSGQVESNKIGLRTAEKILTQMGGSFRRHEADGKFTAEAILPIVPENADE